MVVMNVDGENFFTKMVDDLVEFAEYDEELKEGIKFLDSQARKHGISFYDEVFKILYNHDVNMKAKDWLRKK